MVRQSPFTAGFILFSSLLGFFIPGTAQAQSAGLVRTLYGTETFVRENGATTTYNESFTVPSYFEAPFTLIIENGEADPTDPNGKPDHAVSSAHIFLNGEEISGPSDYNQNVIGFEREIIVVQAGNELEVRLNGKPGAFLTITITGFVRLFPMVEARTGHSDILPPDGHPLLHGGHNNNGILSNSEYFDFSIFSFYPGLSSLLSGRAEHSASILPDASHLIVGGEDVEYILPTAERFQPVVGYFTGLPGELKIPRSGHTATTVIDGRAIVIGGRSTGTTDSGEVFNSQPVLIFKPPFDPEAGVFSVLQKTLTVPRWNHTATLLPGGQILITGGQNEDGFLDSAELFDPITERFTPLATSLSQPRSGHSATLMPDGQVLILGGRDEWGVFPTAERYDPATQSFIPIQQGMILPRAGHTATLMPTGEVLVAGGENADGILDTGELYVLETGDTVPPTVVETSPPKGSEGLDLTEIIGIRFSEPVDVRTLTKSSVLFKNENDEPVDFTLSPAEEGLLLYLKPSGKLSPGTFFTLSLTGGITDTAGNTLSPFSFSFQTVPEPIIYFASPRPGQAGKNVTIYGDYFDDSAPSRNIVTINGVEAPVLQASASQLKVQIPWDAPLGPATVSVTTRGGSDEYPYYSVNAPFPTLTSISPVSVEAGTGPATVTLYGTGFHPDSSVEFRPFFWFPGTILAPVEVSQNKIVFVIPAYLTEDPGWPEILVLNPGYRYSNPLYFEIFAPTPVITSLSPSSALLDGDGFTLTVYGESFMNIAQVSFNGPSYPTTVVSRNELRVEIPASAVSTSTLRNAKVINVVVRNGWWTTSNHFPFEVQNPVPEITSLSPSKGIAGYPNVHFKTILVEGSGFNWDTKIEFNGVLIPTARYSENLLAGFIYPSAVSRVGALDVRAVNPEPGGGISSTLTYNALPIISGSSPEKIHQGAFHRKVRITAPPIMPGAGFEIEGDDITVHSVTPSVTYSVEDNRTGNALFNWMDASDGFPPLYTYYTSIPFPFYLFSESGPFYLWNERPFITNFGLDFSPDYPRMLSPANPGKIPDAASLPNAFMAPFWDSVSGGSIKIKTFGEEPNRKRVFQWSDFSGGVSGGNKTYQIVLEELTGKITFQYLSGFQSSGTSAAVGIEGVDGKQGKAYLVNGVPAEHLLSNGLAVSFTPKKEFILDVSVTPDAPLGPRDVTVTLSRPDLTNKPVVITQEAVLEVVPSPTGIVITSPTTGSSLDYNTVMVEGLVPTTQDEIGVVVNGVIAQVSGSWFIANNVPLAPGENTITAIATDFEGNTTSDSVVVTSTGTSKPIELYANPESGIGPLEVEFSAFTSLPGTLTRFTLDTNGDGIPEFDLPEIPDTLSNTYTEPGLHFPTATVEDDQGNVYSDTVAVNVGSFEALDGLLQNRWSGMLTSLENQDIDSALLFFTINNRAFYDEQFTALESFLPEIANDLKTIQLYSMADNRSQYEIITERSGEIRSLHLLFVKDIDGLWKIKTF